MSAPEPAAATAAGPRPDRRAPWAVALVVAGLVLLAAFALLKGTEDHAYASGSPPTQVEVTAGRTYSLALPGGVTQVARALGDPSALACTITPDGEAGRQLAVAPVAFDTRALHQIASFVAPVSGRVAIGCQSLPRVYVDDADDTGTDWAGVSLLLATICLTVGLPLLLSVLRRGGAPGRPGRQ